jgi:phosphatidylserine decarboxylase
MVWGVPRWLDTLMTPAAPVDDDNNTPPTPPATHPLLRGLRTLRDKLLLQEDLNFLLTNRIPRIAATRFMGWFSQIRHPLVARASIGIWRLFADLDLRDAQQARFASLHECFTRALKPGARTVDMDEAVLASPSDAIVGACGAIEGTQVIQAKGFPYELAELLGGNAALAERYRDGCYATLRLTSTMYHRFHAPCDARLTHCTYISGDTWNVNPIALKRVEKLFCRNERAVLHLQTSTDTTQPPLLLVPVAAVLVASLRLHALDVLLHLRWRGPNEMPCDVPVARGQEMGWFEHGSTIIVLAPRGHTLCPGIAPGREIRMGQRLMAVPG